MPKYKKCPRCEVNYILEDADYCEICQKELKGQRVIDEELLDCDDFVLGVDEEVDNSDYAMEICSRCGASFRHDGEVLCPNCRPAATASKLKGEMDEPDDWSQLIEKVDDEDFIDDEDLSLEQLADEELVDDAELREEFDEEYGKDISDDDTAVYDDTSDDEEDEEDIVDPDADYGDDEDDEEEEEVDDEEDY